MRTLKIVMLRASIMSIEGSEPRKRVHADAGETLELPEEQARRLVKEKLAKPWRPEPANIDDFFEGDGSVPPRATGQAASEKVTGLPQRGRGSAAS